MVQVIAKGKWIRWCEAKKLEIVSSRFALETCYYGIGFRTRPGTVVVTDTEIIHHSYSWIDTLWAAFEPSIRIVVPVKTIREVRRLKFNFGLNSIHVLPNAAFQIETQDGVTHVFILQRRGKEFAEALRSFGLVVADEEGTS